MLLLRKPGTSITNGQVSLVAQSHPSELPGKLRSGHACEFARAKSPNNRLAVIEVCLLEDLRFRG